MKVTTPVMAYCITISFYVPCSEKEIGERTRMIIARPVLGPPPVEAAAGEATLEIEFVPTVMLAEAMTAPR